MQVVAAGMFYGPEAYFTSGWNIMDGSLVIISIIDLLMSLVSESSPRIFGILRVSFDRTAGLPRRDERSFPLLGVQIAALSAAAEGHQQSARIETRRADASLFPPSHRQHRPHMLYIFHHIRDSRRAGTRFSISWCLFYSLRAYEPTVSRSFSKELSSTAKGKISRG